MATKSQTKSSQQLWQTQGTRTTDGIEVAVETCFIPEQSYPNSTIYYFGYRVTITNQRPDKVRLLRRNWKITDGYGRVEEVEGDGVVGQQPTLLPTQSYRYESFCPLPTDSGMMQGYYTMQANTELLVYTPQLSLIAPFAMN